MIGASYMIITRWKEKVFMSYYRRQMIKSGIVMVAIFGFALVATYHIYYKFKDTRTQISSSSSLEVIFHEKRGDKVMLTKVTPVSDSVGLSSHAYTFTIKNNENHPVNYSVKLVKDQEEIVSDDCGEYQIPVSIIKGAIHKEGEDNHFFMLTDLKDNTLISRKLKAGDSISYTVRIWTTSNTLPIDSDMHYHGRVQVVENGVDIATAIP